jgi:hypothetical protein
MEAAATAWLNAAEVPVRRAAPAKKLFAAAATEKIVRDRPLHALSPYERQRLAEALDAEEAVLAAPGFRSRYACADAARTNGSRANAKTNAVRHDASSNAIRRGTPSSFGKNVVRALPAFLGICTKIAFTD